MNDEIRIEVGLVNHLAYLGCVSFDSIIVWSSTHYNDEPCFKLAVSEPATIREAIEMLNNGISAFPVSDDLKLAIIADEYLNRSSDVLMDVSKTRIGSNTSRRSD